MLDHQVTRKLNFFISTSNPFVVWKTCKKILDKWPFLNWWSKNFCVHDTLPSFWTFQYCTLIGVLCRKKIGHNGNSIEKSLHDILFVLLIDLRVLQSLGQNKRHVKILWQIIGEKARENEWNCSYRLLSQHFPDIFTRVYRVLRRLAEIVLWTFFCFWEVFSL